MIEIPEALTISRQINDTITGKHVSDVVAAYSPHKFAWYHGDPQNYKSLLMGKTIDKASAYAGMVEIKAGYAVMLFGDGINLRFYGKDEKRPSKHQLLLEFDDGTAISGSVQMYGGLWCFRDGEFDNQYFEIAKVKPSPLSDNFNREYFEQIISLSDIQKLSVKALLATEQRIPGLGNGVLQDILYNAKIHPKRKVNSLSSEDRDNIFSSIKSTLGEMVSQGGRDTEKNLFGQSGGYKTRLSKNTSGKPCPICGSTIEKENYMGGSIYYCSGCQR